MRIIHTNEIIDRIKNLCIEANIALREDVIRAYQQALHTEKSELGREVLKQLLENAEYAAKEKLPFCQDTGYAVFFIELGQNIHIEGGLLTEAIHEGVRQGYTQGCLRKSMLKSPICRVNTGDNTPAMINYDLVLGEKMKISLLIKGCGCDNMSRLKMFTPAEGLAAAKKFIIETIDQAGPNASPPVTIGIGLGGPFARAAVLAQKALLWPIGKINPDSQLASLESELLEEINALGIGPAGYGGTVTAFGLHIESGATHIASFPVAVNIDCHSHRVKEITL
ncbi:L(+)-tartrate dehydratase subunit alpha [Legionella lansingensis]|uniref:L(+)-tartrate dehydratase subunit alpha n=1 Tax=Legionella lansingensis TaxID=45067 RepID=A0A0W0VHN3_9GAMM|nr:fumarate hydratase [Legionella lansingensis]KTD19350.1 L(+)-tartrate dehydratase subunit alpha [Legionella lansingensis]SNV52967.1 L(+)-tartrate dehydratase subunit alpha [Legionella lansingensis]